MEAEDVVQDSFARVWERRKQVEYDKAKSYLFTTAYHLIVDLSRKRRQETTEEVLFQVPDKNTTYPDVNEILHKAVDTLPEAQRTAVLLRDYEGYSYQEIGDITGQTEAQVKINIFRARTTLRNMLQSMDNLIDIEP